MKKGDLRRQAILDTAEALFIHLHHQPPLKPNRGLPRAL